MNRLLKWVLVPAVAMAFCVGTADAASWTFHFSHPSCPGGILEVWATHDCNKLGDPWFSGFAKACQSYAGQVADEVDGQEVNDIIFTFDWGIDGEWPPCQNYDEIKFAAPSWNGDTEEWELERLYSWLDINVDGSMTLPGIGDDDGDVQLVYTAVNLWQWDNRPLLPVYEFVDGECPDLPGYLTGTTPIVFNPGAGPGDNPFETTPFTGVLPRTGEVFLRGQPPIPAVSEWGLVLLTLIGLATGTILFRRRRQLGFGA